MHPPLRSTMDIVLDVTLIGGMLPLVQWLFYGAHITVLRVSIVTLAVSAVVGLWTYADGRGIGRKRPTGRLALGLGASYGVQVLVYGVHATPVRAGGVILVLYGLTKLRQAWREVTLEVSLDFVIGLGVNLGGQRLIYGALASTPVMTTFTAVFLPLAYLRRLGTRLLFRAWLPPGQRQPRWHAALEVTCDTLLALLSAYGLQVVWYGTAATLERAGGLTVALYAAALVRRYLFRRVFEAWETRQDRRREREHVATDVHTDPGRAAQGPAGSAPC
jgi:hypothetical protein